MVLVVVVFKYTQLAKMTIINILDIIIWMRKQVEFQSMLSKPWGASVCIEDNVLSTRTTRDFVHSSKQLYKLPLKHHILRIMVKADIDLFWKSFHFLRVFPKEILFLICFFFLSMYSEMGNIEHAIQLVIPCQMVRPQNTYK